MRIAKIIRTEYAPDRSYANVHVQLSDGATALVWVGGEVEEYFHHGKHKARVKRKSLDSKREGVVDLS